MRRKKKITIVTFESHERVTIRAARQLRGWCERCGTEVLMVTPNEAAALTRLDARAIFRGVETGDIHFIECDQGELLVCSRSLSK